ncbi:hypothetical protein [Nocardia aurea]|uniref:hypothetical protein n=1 Tax=Nocardia aurea TaxID=2144174 RepID=UPI0033A843A1
MKWAVTNENPVPVDDPTCTGFLLSDCLFQLGTGLPEYPASHDQLLDLLGAFEDVEDLSAGSK